MASSTYLTSDITSRARREYLFQRIRELSADPFPPAARGERVSIEIASMRLDLITSDRPLAARLREYFSSYMFSGMPSGATPQPRPPRAELWLLTSEEDLWEDEDSDFHERENAVVHRDFAAIRLDSEVSAAPLRVVALVNSALDDAFHNLLRWVAPRLLIGHQCFLLHGAGVIHSGEGFVFFGQSGAGKSTSSGLIRESDPQATLVGDDAVIVQIDDEGRTWLHSAPLGCGYSREAPPAISAPLVGLFSLRQADHNRVAELSVSQGVAAMLASAMNMSATDDVDERIDLACAFASSGCGIRALHFTRDPSFWPLVLQSKSDHNPLRRTDVHPAQQN